LQNADVLSDYYFNQKEMDNARDKFVRYLFTIKETKLFNKIKNTEVLAMRTLHKPFLSQDYAANSLFENPKLNAKKQTFVIQLDDGILSSQRTARNVLGAEFVNSTAISATEDAFAA